MMVTLDIDPLMLASLERLAAGRNRTELIRDAIYSYVWDARRNGGINVRRAPTYSKLIEDEPRRVVNGKLVSVDEWGLLKE